MKIVGAYCAFYDIAADMCHGGRGMHRVWRKAEKREARACRAHAKRESGKRKIQDGGNNARVAVSRAGGANSRFDFNFNAGKRKALSEKRSFLFLPHFFVSFSHLYAARGSAANSSEMRTEIVGHDFIDIRLYPLFSFSSLSLPSGFLALISVLYPLVVYGREIFTVFQ